MQKIKICNKTPEVLYNIDDDCMPLKEEYDYHKCALEIQKRKKKREDIAINC